MIEALLILISLLLVAACAGFVAAEFALVTVDRSTVERAAEAGDPGARGTLEALRSLSTQLSGAQVGITLTNLLIGFLAEPSVAELVDGPLESLGVGDTAASGLSLVIALVLATSVTMIFGELVPKNLAIARPLQTAAAVQGFQRGFTRGAGPVIRFFNDTANRVLRRLGVEPTEELASARTAEELGSLVARSAQKGTLETETATLLQRSLAFGDRRALDAMTPRVRMHTLSPQTTALEVLQTARATGHSRFPVLRQGEERIVGVVHVKDAMGIPHARRGEVEVSAFLREPVLVPSTMQLDELLEMLRHGGIQMAVVVDEFGGIDGLVTLEDLIEELVGEVRDEHDLAVEHIRSERDGSWSLSGLLRPDEASAAVGVTLPEDDDYETLAGLVALHLGRLPEHGDTVTLVAEDAERRPRRVTIEVVAMDDLRVDRVRLRHEALPDADEDGGA